MNFFIKFFLINIIIITLFLTSFGFSPYKLNDDVLQIGSDENEKQDKIEKLQSDYDSLVKEYEKQKEKYDMLLEENADLDKIIIEKEEEIASKEYRVDTLEEKLKNVEDVSYIEQLESQVARLKKLLDEINPLLKNIYIGSSDPEEINYTFTAFSINYDGSFYIVTAGHCVADNYGEDGKFKFKANFSNKWIYPELIGYKADFSNLDDYAVFYSNDIESGFKVSEIETEDNYLPGSIDKGLSVFRNLGDSSKRGESGSPVVNEYGEVVGIYVVYGLVYTPIQLALDLIDDYRRGNKEEAGVDKENGI